MHGVSSDRILVTMKETNFFSIKRRLGVPSPSKFDEDGFLENLHIFLTERDRESWVVPKFAK